MTAPGWQASERSTDGGFAHVCLAVPDLEGIAARQESDLLARLV